MVTDKAVGAAHALLRRDAEKLVRRLGDEIGLKGLKLDSDGAAWFADPSGNLRGLLHIENRPGLLVLAAMPAAVVRSRAALDTMLQANLDAAAVAGGAFGHVPGRDEPFLMAMVPADASDVGGLSQYLDAFFDLAAEWCEEFDGPEFAMEFGAQNTTADGPPAGSTV